MCDSVSLTLILTMNFPALFLTTLRIDRKCLRTGVIGKRRRNSQTTITPARVYFGEHWSTNAEHGTGVLKTFFLFLPE